MGFLDEVGDVLFGEKPKVHERQHKLLSPEQEKLMSTLIGSFQGGAKPVSAQLSPEQRTSLAGLEQMALNQADPGQVSEGQETLQRILQEGRYTPGSQLATEGTDIIKSAVQSDPAAAFDTSARDLLMDLAGTATEDFSNFYRENVAAPLYREFSEEVLPMIDRSFGGADFFSTDRMRAVDASTEDLIGALTRGRNEALLGARGQALQAAGAAGEFDLTRGRTELEGALSQRGQDIEAGSRVAGAGIDQNRLLADAFLQGRGQDIQASQIMDQLAQGDTETALNSLIALFEAGGVEQQLKKGERDTILEALLNILKTPTRENTVVATPGTPGLAQSFLGGLGQGAGKMLGGMF